MVSMQHLSPSGTSRLLTPSPGEQQSWETMETGGRHVTACACTPALDLCPTSGTRHRNAELLGSFGVLRQQRITTALLPISFCGAGWHMGTGLGSCQGQT